MNPREAASEKQERDVKTGNDKGISYPEGKIGSDVLTQIAFWQVNMNPVLRHI